MSGGDKARRSLWGGAGKAHEGQAGWGKAPAAGYNRNVPDSSSEWWLTGAALGKGPQVSCSHGPCSYLGDQLRSGHAEEVTQAVPLASHERELCVPGGREGKSSFSGRDGWLAVKPVASYRLSGNSVLGAQNPSMLASGETTENGTRQTRA